MQQANILKRMIRARIPTSHGKTEDCWILIVIFESSFGSTRSSDLPGFGMTTTSSGVVVVEASMVDVSVVDVVVEVVML